MRLPWLCPREHKEAKRNIPPTNSAWYIRWLSVQAADLKEGWREELPEGRTQWRTTRKMVVILDIAFILAMRAFTPAACACDTEWIRSLKRVWVPICAVGRRCLVPEPTTATFGAGGRQQRHSHDGMRGGPGRTRSKR